MKNSDLAVKPTQQSRVDKPRQSGESIFKRSSSELTANHIQLNQFNQFQLDTSQVQELPKIQAYQAAIPQQKTQLKQQQDTTASTARQTLDFFAAIRQVVQHRPEITQSIAAINEQLANIRTAKAAYYPQVSGGLSTADFNSGERGRQVYSLTATQMVYDFGKVKSAVQTEEAKLLQQQAQMLVDLDEISYQTAEAMLNIQHFEEMIRIATAQNAGIAKIAEIAQLRAQAGISSQADPIQAKSSLEAAQSSKIVLEMQLSQNQQKLRTLLGYDISNLKMSIPETLIQQSGLYQDVEYQQIPKIILAQTAIQVAKSQRKETDLSIYPTLSLTGSLTQAVNGRNPNNNVDNGSDSSIMLEASSNFFQGGAVASKKRAADFAEQSAKAEVNTMYLEILDQIRLIYAEIENKQRLINVLSQRQDTARITKELYQEQYKLGTRTILDLLNAEQAIHSAAQEIATARYDIYAAMIRHINITGRSRNIYQLNNVSIQGIEVKS